MAQTQFTNYKAPVESFPLGQQHIGILKPGRYNGFNTMSSAGGMLVEIGHLGTVRKTTKTGDPVNIFGAVIMPTGIIIHEDAAIELAISSNVGNNFNRKDILICEHTYQEITGGTAATYSIIQGVSENRPVLPIPSKQIILGTFEIEAGSNNYAGITYIPEVPPLQGDMVPQDIYNLISDLIIQSVEQNGGENNTASSSGIGVGIFRAKNGIDLEFKSLVSSDGSLKIESVGPENEEVDLRVNQGVVEITGYQVLNDTHHNKTLVIKPNLSQIVITVPLGLRSDFVCGFILHGPTDNPSGQGIRPYQTTNIPPVTFVRHTGVVITSKNGYYTIDGPGSSVLLQCVGPQNWYTLLGDLKAF